jgi:ABC-type iron transport system FetAB permease component
MLVEKITSATFSNGLLRLETSIVNPKGQLESNGSIQIPGTLVGNVINEMSLAAKDISNQLSDNDNDSKENQLKSNGKKDSKKKK